MKITFKKEPKATGLAAVGHSNQSVKIKFDGKEIGRIIAPTWQTTDHKWGLGFTVKTPNDPNAPKSWRWFFLKQRFDTEEQARQFVLDNSTKIVELNLHSLT